MVHQLTDVSDWLNLAASPTGEGSAVLFAVWSFSQGCSSGYLDQEELPEHGGKEERTEVPR